LQNYANGETLIVFLAPQFWSNKSRLHHQRMKDNCIFLKFQVFALGILEGLDKLLWSWFFIWIFEFLFEEKINSYIKILKIYDLGHMILISISAQEQNLCYHMLKKQFIGQHKNSKYFFPHTKYFCLYGKLLFIPLGLVMRKLWRVLFSRHS